MRAAVYDVLRTLPVAAAMFLFSLAASAQLILPTALDLAADAAIVERAGKPLIVMVSLSGCPHCDVVSRAAMPVSHVRIAL